MGLLDFLFGKKDAKSTEILTEKEILSKFEILKTDGVRAKHIGEWPYAIRCFREALKYQPHDAETESYLAEAYLHIDDKEEAYPLLKKLCTLQPENLELLLHLIQVSAALRRWEDVATYSQQALQIDANEVRTHYIMAEANHAQGYDQEAINNLTIALTLEPHYQAALRLRARLYRDTAQYDAAEQDALCLRQIDDQVDDYCVLLAKIYHLQHRDTEALHLLRTARQLNPFARKAITCEVAIYHEQGDAQTALHTLNEAITEMPDFIEAYTLRAATYRMMHEEQKAQKDEEQAEQLTTALEQAQDTMYANVSNQMEERYRNMNPYKF